MEYDLKEDNWSEHLSGSNTEPYYIPYGVKDWYYGSQDNVDIKIKTDG